MIIIKSGFDFFCVDIFDGLKGRFSVSKSNFEALEVGCWIPLLLGKKAVLAGDHQQLSACVKSSSAQQQGLDQLLGM